MCVCVCVCVCVFVCLCVCVYGSAYVCTHTHTNTHEIYIFYMYVCVYIYIYIYMYIYIYESGHTVLASLVLGTVYHKATEAVSIQRLFRTCVRQHTSAYVSIRQHTSAYVSTRQHTSAYVSIQRLIRTLCVIIDEHRHNDGASMFQEVAPHSHGPVPHRQLLARKEAEYTSAYVSIRQHTSA